MADTPASPTPLELTVLSERAIPEVVQAGIRAQFLPDTLQPQASPMVYAMAGIPGAGKSSYVDQELLNGRYPKNAFLLDPDRVMQALPMYQSDFGKQGAEAAYVAWELPARRLAYALFDEAIDKGLSLIIDMGQVRRENYDKLCQLKARGYRLNLTYIYCPVEVAISRLPDRIRHTGPAMVRDRAAALIHLLPLYQNLADEFKVLDNSDLSHPYRPTTLEATRGA